MKRPFIGIVLLSKDAVWAYVKDSHGKGRYRFDDHHSAEEWVNRLWREHWYGIPNGA